LCPHCFAAVAPSDEAVPQPLYETSGRLAGEGYVLRVDESRVFPRLIVESQYGQEFARRVRPMTPTQPGIRLAGGIMCLVMPAALALVHPILGMIVAAGLAPILIVTLWRHSVTSSPEYVSKSHLIDFAWMRLVSKWNPESAEPSQTRFLARLAVSSF